MRDEPAPAALRQELHAELLGYGHMDDVELLAVWIHRWRKTGNAHYMLHALLKCEAGEIPIRDALRKEIVAAARALLEERSLGTPQQVMRDVVRRTAMFWMHSLVYAGRRSNPQHPWVTVGDAAGSAAAWAARLGQPLKASYLQKLYERQPRKLREQVFAAWDKQPGLRIRILRFAEKLPEPPPEWIGNRKA